MIDNCISCHEEKDTEDIEGIPLCVDCRYLIGAKIATTGPSYSIESITNRQTYLQILRDMHNGIHDQWFHMKTSTYELFHFLTCQEMIGLGMNLEDFCLGELMNLFSIRAEINEGLG